MIRLLFSPGEIAVEAAATGEEATICGAGDICDGKRDCWRGVMLGCCMLCTTYGVDAAAAELDKGLLFT